MKQTLLTLLLACSFISNAQTAIQFDGVDDSIVLGSHTNFAITNALTIECWIQFPTNAYTTGICSYEYNGSGYPAGWWLGLDGTGPWWWMADTLNQTAGYNIYGTSPIADGLWHHLAGTYANDTARIYVDGVLEGTLEVLNIDLDVDTIVNIGFDNEGSYSDISIEDVRIWNIERSGTEIDDWKDSCLTGNEAGLVGYYHFEEGSGTVTEDLTPNTNDGVLHNFANTAWVAGLNCVYCDFNANTASMNATSCDSVVSPSGNYVWVTTGMYQDTLTNTNGCDSVITANITISPLDATTTTTGAMITANQAGASYQWIDCSDSTAIGGETSQSFTATQDGSYAVVVDNGSCSDTSACVVVQFFGLLENPNIKMLVYPNPTNGEVNVTINNVAAETIQITVLDLLGQIVFTTPQTVLNGQQSWNSTLDLNALSAGTYIIQISIDEETISSRFQKQ